MENPKYEFIPIKNKDTEITYDANTNTYMIYFDIGDLNTLEAKKLLISLQEQVLNVSNSNIFNIENSNEDDSFYVARKRNKNCEKIEISPDRYCYYVYVGDSTPTEAMEILKYFRKQFGKK